MICQRSAIETYDVIANQTLASFVEFLEKTKNLSEISIKNPTNDTYLCATGIHAAKNQYKLDLTFNELFNQDLVRFG